MQQTWSFSLANHKKIGSANCKFAECNNFRNKLLVCKFAVLRLRNIGGPPTLESVGCICVYRLLKYIMCSHEDRMDIWKFLTFMELRNQFRQLMQQGRYDKPILFRSQSPYTVLKFCHMLLKEQSIPVLEFLDPVFVKLSQNSRFQRLKSSVLGLFSRKLGL